TGLKGLKICVGYEIDGERVNHRPASLKRMAACTPLYEELPGWQDNISGAREVDQLPEEARAYIKAIEDMSGIPVSIISVGPGRDETIMVKYPS
ncbi:MAG: adenylosuccinate synthetase, partial [Desulfobacteraceae bacterium]|nr:adenylosuccinate synthetase [Desulfobacteraceae bacterium]